MRLTLFVDKIKKEPWRALDTAASFVHRLIGGKLRSGDGASTSWYLVLISGLKPLGVSDRDTRPYIVDRVTGDCAGGIFQKLTFISRKWFYFVRATDIRASLVPFELVDHSNVGISSSNFV